MFKESFLFTLTPMLVLFLCIGIGFVLKRTKLLPDNAGTVMSKLENWIFCPALTVSTFATRFTAENLKSHYSLFLFSMIAAAAAFVIGILLSRLIVRERSYERNIYKYALTFANYGFMGDPIVLGLFGADILFYYKLFTLPLTILIYSWGISALIPDGKNNTSIIKKFINPLFISLVIGAVIGITGLGSLLPAFVSSTLENLAECMGPVAMLLTGFTIGGCKLKEIATDVKVYIASVLRLAFIPTIIIGLLLLLRASNIAILCAFFAYATPLGLNTVVLPLAYGANPKTGASMAIVSHCLSFVSIPLMFAILSRIVDLSAFIPI